MATNAQPDELRMIIEKGDVLDVRGAKDSLELGLHFQMGVGISALFGCQTVLVKHWLPNLDLVCVANAPVIRGTSPTR